MEKNSTKTKKFFKKFGVYILAGSLAVAIVLTLTLSLTKVGSDKNINQEPVVDVDTKIYVSTDINKKATFRNINILNVEEINEKVSILENDIEGMKDGINLLFSNNVIEGSVWTNPDGGIYNVDDCKRWKPFEVKKGTYYYYGGSENFCCYKTQNGNGC